VRELRAALLAEGSSDRGLIGVLERVCVSKGIKKIHIDWGDERLAPFDLGRALTPRIQKLLEVDPGYDLLFVHRDADSEDAHARYSEIRLACANQATCPPHVCVVPIQELEAWLLVDETAILRLVGGSKSISLGLPKPKQLERRAKPKELLADALARAKVRRPSARPKPLKSREFGLLRAQLLENLNIEGDVTQLSAWQRLLSDIDEAIALLRLEFPTHL